MFAHRHQLIDLNSCFNVKKLKTVAFNLKFLLKEKHWFLQSWTPQKGVVRKTGIDRNPQMIASPLISPKGSIMRVFVSTSSGHISK